MIIHRVCDTIFNSSIFEYENKYAMLGRVGHTVAHIVLTGLNDSYNLNVNPEKIVLPDYDEHRLSQEDARAFFYNGKPWMAYSGIQEHNTQYWNNQMVATIDGSVCFPIIYKDRGYHEKNWMFFEQDNKLYAIHHHHPWTVLEIIGDTARLVLHKKFEYPGWEGIELRGGANPIKIGNEYYYFGHSFKDSSYSIYCGVFGEDFLLKRVSGCLLAATDDDWGPYKRKVVFPCGAIFKNDKFIVSYGRKDEFTEIVEFDKQEIEQCMVAVV